MVLSVSLYYEQHVTFSAQGQTVRITAVIITRKSRRDECECEVTDGLGSQLRWTATGWQSSPYILRPGGECRASGTGDETWDCYVQALLLGVSLYATEESEGREVRGRIHPRIRPQKQWPSFYSVATVTAMDD